MKKLHTSLRLTLLGALTLLLSSCGPSLEERVAQARTPELLMEVGEDVLESVDDQESLDLAKVYIVQLYRHYQELDSKAKQKLVKQFMLENKSIDAEVNRILQLDLEIGHFSDPTIDQHVKAVLRLLKQMNKPIKLR